MSRKSAHSILAAVIHFYSISGFCVGFVNQYAPELEIVKQINAYKPDFLYMNKSRIYAYLFIL